MTTTAFTRPLLATFWTGSAVLVLYALSRVGSVSPVNLLIGLVLVFFSMLPSYLWCAGKVGGLPLFPVLAVTYLWTFALPFVQNHPALARYDIAALVKAAVTVVLFLGLGTAVWFGVARVDKGPPSSFWGFDQTGGTTVFQFCLLLACAFQLCSLSGLFAAFSPSVYSLIRAVTLSLATLAVTVLSYRLGCRKLSSGQTTVFVVLLGAFLFFNAAGLMLAPAMATLMMAVGTYTVGRGRFPLTLVIVAFAILSILHAGKAQMRKEFWAHRKALLPADYPRFYARWFTFGLTHLPESLSGEPKNRQKKTSLLERSSIVQMLLLVQSKSPEEKPYLYGQTYAILPQLLVPRILYDKKVWSHEGTYILSIHYGLQTRKTTRGTTIGFGLLPEAYANFGFPGVIGLALLLGGGYGLATRWSLHVPVASFRGLFALLMLALAVRTEHTAGVLVSSLFQASVTLMGLALFLMRRQPLLASQPELRGAVLAQATL
jgi:hypothetical protein